MEFHKTLFVPPTGNFKVFEPQLSGLLAILLLFRLKLAWMVLQALLVVFISAGIFLMFSISPEFFLSRGVLLSLLFFLFFLLRSEPVRAYVNR